MVGLLHSFVLLKPYLKKAFRSNEKVIRAQHTLTSGTNSFNSQRAAVALIDQLPLITTQNAIKILDVET